MKTMLLLMVVSLSVATLTFGSGQPGMAIRKQKEPGLYTLIYKAEKKGDLTVVVSDNLGALLFKELIQDSDGFSRSLNFKYIVPGEYFIQVIEPEGKRKTQKLNHQMPAPELKLEVL